MTISASPYPRRFVPVEADMGDWSQVEPLFDRLETRPIGSPAELEQWLLDLSELNACLSQESSRRYVAMTGRTDDPDLERAWLDFIENIEPKWKERCNRLDRRYVSLPQRTGLDPARYLVYDRNTAVGVEIFRDENVPLQTEDARLDQRYQKICGAMTVTWDGREQTLQQMARYLQEPDRDLRRRAWELITDRRLADREAIEEIFDAMLDLRARIAAQAGLANFRDYQFKAYRRFDYTPADCFTFHRTIERLIVPAFRELQRRRARLLGVEPLRPWDLAVDPHNRPPLRPFEEAGALSAGCSAIFHRLDPPLGAQFDSMVAAGWLDLESRKGKAPGGYQATFDEDRHPFIFMNAVGLHRDVETLLHEGGHAFHALACRDEPLLAYRHCGMEMAEVASMGMELLACDHLDVFYSGEDLVRARREQLEGIVSTFCWVAVIDAFQHWLYEHPGHTRAQRAACWLELLERFGGIEDYGGYETARQYAWQRQLHLFGVPLYYIEYAIAQVGALQLWTRARRDKVQALRDYRRALVLGGSRPLPELWEAAGLRFDFSEQTVGPLIETVLTELKNLT